MSKAKVKNAAVTYELVPLRMEVIKLPPELDWLYRLTPDEQRAFLQAMLEALVGTWQSSDVAPLQRVMEQWRQQAQERQAATVQVERQTLWARHESQLSQQRALINELLRAATSSIDTVPVITEIRAMLGQYIPFTDKLSDEIITTRYEEHSTISISPSGGKR